MTCADPPSEYDAGWRLPPAVAMKSSSGFPLRIFSNAYNNLIESTCTKLRK